MWCSVKYLGSFDLENKSMSFRGKMTKKVQKSLLDFVTTHKKNACFFVDVNKNGFFDAKRGSETRYTLTIEAHHLSKEADVFLKKYKKSMYVY